MPCYGHPALEGTVTWAGRASQSHLHRVSVPRVHGLDLDWLELEEGLDRARNKDRDEPLNRCH